MAKKKTNKTNKKTGKKTSRKWISNHLNDKYVKLANKENLKSRSSYKIKQINEKYKLIKPGAVVLDLGAAPGGWSQIVAGIIGEEGLLVAIDLLPITGIPRAKVLLGDIYSEEILAKVDELLRKHGDEQVSVVISDMAPNLSGIASTDAARVYELNRRALFYAIRYLKPSGGFVVKVFRNEHYDAFIKDVKAVFTSCAVYKPDASRSKSAEIYIVAKGKRKT